MASDSDEDSELAVLLEAAIDAGDITQVRSIVNKGLTRSESYNELYDMYGPSGRADEELERDPNGDWALAIAVHDRNAELTHELFRAGANPETTSPDTYPQEWPHCPSHWIQSGYELFNQAVFGGDVATTKEFLDAGVYCQVDSLVDTMDCMEEEDQWDALKTVLGAAGSRTSTIARYFHRDDRLSIATLERLREYTQSTRSRLLVVYAAVKLKMLAIRARERAWRPGGSGALGRKRAFDQALAM